MSRHFTLSVIALLVIFGGFMTYLNSANSRLNAESLKREREMPCYAPEQARQLSARCVILPPPGVKA